MPIRFLFIRLLRLKPLSFSHLRSYSVFFEPGNITRSASFISFGEVIYFSTISDLLSSGLKSVKFEICGSLITAIFILSFENSVLAVSSLEDRLSSSSISIFVIGITPTTGILTPILAKCSLSISKPGVNKVLSPLNLFITIPFILF